MARMHPFGVDGTLRRFDQWLANRRRAPPLHFVGE
jgi:hypothetical protein